MDIYQQRITPEKIKSMIAYLSGGMEHAVNEGEDWRNNMTEWLHKNLEHSVVDPVKSSRQIVVETNSHEYRSCSTEMFTQFAQLKKRLSELYG